MQTRFLKPKHGPEIFVRPLRHGDTAAVQAVFDPLGDELRRTRFNGAKRRLGEQELRWLATVGSKHHALVGDACAAGIVEVTALVRSDNQAALAILQRALGQLEVRFEGPEMLVRAPLPAVC
jgi:hypothetical protein